MGMSASQVRFLSLQNRKNTIGLNLMTLSNRRTALSRDMSRVAANYNDAMNQKLIKWTNDSGMTYQDINYDLLMKPNDLNATMPYIVTDAQGRVVLDDNKIVLDGEELDVTYRDLATMISAYSGFDVCTKYNNTNGLTGDSNVAFMTFENENGSNQSVKTINSKTITGGLANTENPYNIVSSSTSLTNGSLQFDLMNKLGLLTTDEVTEINSLLTEINGDAHNGEGPHPVTCLRGKYYLYQAHIDAYNAMYSEINTMVIGGFKNGENLEGDAAKRDDTESLKNITNTVVGGAAALTFTLKDDSIASTYLSNIDFSKDANKHNLTEYNNLMEGQSSLPNLSYTAKEDGTLTYTYSQNKNLLSMLLASYETMGSVDQYCVHEGGLNTNDVNGCGGAITIYSTTNWANLYNTSMVLSGTNGQVLCIYRNDSYTNDSSVNGHFALSNLINNFGTAIQNVASANGVTCDATAIKNAKDATLSTFLGQLGNDANANNTNRYYETGYKHSDEHLILHARDGADDENAVGECDHGGRKKIQGTYEVVSPYNLFRTFLSFYNAFTNHSNAVSQMFGGQSENLDFRNNAIPDKVRFTANYDINSDSINDVEKGVYEYTDDNEQTHYDVEYTTKTVGNPYNFNGSKYINIVYTTYNYTSDSADGTTGPYYTDGAGNKQTVTINSDGTPSDNCRTQVIIETYDYNDSTKTMGTNLLKQETIDYNDDDGTIVTSAMRAVRTTEGENVYYVYQKKNSANQYSASQADTQNLSREISSGWTECTDTGLQGSAASSGVVTYYYSINGSQKSTTIKSKGGSDYDIDLVTVKLQQAPSASITEIKEKQKDIEDQIASKMAALDKLYSSKQSKIMDYFNALFKMISKNGWVYDENVNNKSNPTQSQEYLNTKLQNNMFFLTEVNSVNGEDYDYATKVVTNVSKVIEIYDEDAANVALSEYEAEKAEITSKEKILDIRINKLEAEEEAISTEMESLKTIIDDNVKSTFKIFS